MYNLPPTITEKEFQDVDTLDEEKIKNTFHHYLNDLHLFLNYLECLQDIQKIRSGWTSKVKYKDAFGTFTTNPRHWYTFNHGGRNEAQFNVGLYASYFRIGLGFEFTLKKGGDTTIVYLTYAYFVKVVRDELEKFKRIVKDNNFEIEWFPSNGKNLEFISNENVSNWLIKSQKEAAWIFIGRLLRRNTDKKILENPHLLKETFKNTFSELKPFWEKTQNLVKIK